MGPEDTLARRIEHERKRRGWSPAQLARRLRDAGCSMNQSSIWKIENGQPRRKISIDEAVGIAALFETSLTELLDPAGLPATVASMAYELEPADDSAAFARWVERLEAYMDGQGEMVAPLRARNAGELPYPEFDNPMMGYLIERAHEIAGESDLLGALAWLGAHAWFEGTIEERARIIRQLTT